MHLFRWLLGLILLVLIGLSAHIRCKWRGEEREWHGPFYEDEWPDEEPVSTSPTRVFWTTLYYFVVLACLGLFAYLLCQWLMRPAADAPNFDQAADYDFGSTADYDDAPQCSYGEGVDPDYDQDFDDPDAQEAPSQEWYLSKQR